MLMGIGDWGLGIGDWGGDWVEQSKRRYIMAENFRDRSRLCFVAWRVLLRQKRLWVKRSALAEQRFFRWLM